MAAPLPMQAEEPRGLEATPVDCEALACRACHMREVPRDAHEGRC